MTNIDVFSGDADGLCGLHQFRLTYRIDSTLLTGVKRDTKLLDRVDANSSGVVSTFNVPVGTNREALFRLLGLGVQCTCFDGHFKGIVRQHPGLALMVDQAAEACTSALVDRYVGGEHRAWAVVGAFGEGMRDLALRLAQPLKLDSLALGGLRELGLLLDYNAHGERIEDLHFHPAELYRMMKPYREPTRLLVDDQSMLKRLRNGRQSDLDKAIEAGAKTAGPGGSIYVLPEGAWSRRIRGDYANHLALKEPDRAHAVLTHNRRDDYAVSVRAPLVRPKGAGPLCEQFEDGGGRSDAAGINRLPAKRLAEFTSHFFAQFQQLGH